MRTTAKSKLKDLRSLLGGDVTVARTALLNQVDRIQMRADGKVYVAKGNWNFFVQLPRDGAGGPACTTGRIGFEVSCAA